jgi:hypothetical protein
MILATFGIVLWLLTMTKASSRPYAIGGIVIGLIGFVFPPAAFVGGILELIALYRFIFK